MPALESTFCIISAMVSVVFSHSNEIFLVLGMKILIVPWTLRVLPLRLWILLNLLFCRQSPCLDVTCRCKGSGRSLLSPTGTIPAKAQHRLTPPPLHQVWGEAHCLQVGTETHQHCREGLREFGGVFPLVFGWNQVGTVCCSAHFFAL